MKTLLSVFSVACLAIADDQFWKKTGEGLEDAFFNMRYLPDSEEVEISVTMNEYGWFGIVLGSPDMTFGSDMLIFFTSPDDTPFGIDVADYSS